MRALDLCCKYRVPLLRYVGTALESQEPEYSGVLPGIGKHHASCLAWALLDNNPKQLDAQADLANVLEFKERQAEVEEALMRLKEENQVLTEKLEQQRVELDRCVGEGKTEHEGRNYAGLCARVCYRRKPVCDAVWCGNADPCVSGRRVKSFYGAGTGDLCRGRGVRPVALGTRPPPHA